jgi:hypothetical protein
LIITTTETVATITKYRDDLRQVLRTYLTTVTGTEPESLIKFIEQGDESALVAINVENSKYLNLLRELSKIVIPKSAAEPYLALLNSLVSITENLYYMTQIKTEPVLALKSSQILPIKKYEFLTLLVPINDYFIQRGLHEKITF